MTVSKGSETMQFANKLITGSLVLELGNLKFKSLNFDLLCSFLLLFLDKEFYLFSFDTETLHKNGFEI